MSSHPVAPPRSGPNLADNTAAPRATAGAIALPAANLQDLVVLEEFDAATGVIYFSVWAPHHPGGPTYTENRSTDAGMYGRMGSESLPPAAMARLRGHDAASAAEREACRRWVAMLRQGREEMAYAALESIVPGSQARATRQLNGRTEIAPAPPQARRAVRPYLPPGPPPSGPLPPLPANANANGRAVGPLGYFGPRPPPTETPGFASPSVD